MRRLAAERGFTLIELLVVILIIAILVLVGLPAYLGQQEKAKIDSARQQLATAYKAARYETITELGSYPDAASIKAAIEKEPVVGDVHITAAVDDVSGSGIHIISDTTDDKHLTLATAVDADAAKVLVLEHDLSSGAFGFSGYGS